MTLIRYRNQTEYAFKVWVSGFPESHHWMDMSRFYVFVKTLLRYRAKKWHDYEYFSNRIKSSNNILTDHDIEYYYDLMLKCIDFHKAASVGISGYDNDGDYGYRETGIKDGEIFSNKITMEQFLK